MPHLVVLVVARDEEHFISDCLVSLLRQSYPEFHLRLVDHASRDQTRVVMEEFAAGDDRISVRHFPNPEAGLSEAKNFGLSDLDPKWVAMADADDTYDEDRLKIQLQLAESKGLDVVGSWMSTTGSAGQEIGTIEYPTEHEEICSLMLQRNCIAHPSVLLRHKSFVLAGGYRIGMKSGQDYDLWLKMIGQGSRFGTVNQRLVRYRVDSNKGNTTEEGVWQKFNILCSWAFTNALGIDPFAQDEMLWRSFQYPLLSKLSVELASTVREIEAIMADAGDHSDNLREARDLAISCLVPFLDFPNLRHLRLGGEE